jgi:uncharacterized membrane protein YedE/YeeE
MFVLGSAVPVYGFAYAALRRKGRSFVGRDFEAPTPRRIDGRLITGATLFGLGWGLAGVCPGPALAHVAFLDAEFAVFLVTMLAGFELQRRLDPN